jgi:hypothetical protein
MMRNDDSLYPPVITHIPTTQKLDLEQIVLYYTELLVEVHSLNDHIGYTQLN